MSYNLNEGADEGIEIVLDGENYVLRYPTVEEVEKLQKLDNDEERGKLFYGFVETTKEGQEPFGEKIKKANLKVIKNFVQAVKAEFNIED